MNPWDKTQKKRKEKKICPKVAQKNCINIVILITEWFESSEKKLGNQNVLSLIQNHLVIPIFLRALRQGNLEEDFEPRGRLTKHQEIPLTSSFNTCKACWALFTESVANGLGREIIFSQNTFGFALILLFILFSNKIAQWLISFL